VTLIDLPGLIRTATKEQSESDIADVKAMVEAYVSQSRTLILAVIPGNVDLQTSEIIQWARKVDPTSKRTLFVVTKVDMVEAGTERTFINTSKSFDTAFHFVVCRGQEQREKQVSVLEWKKEEARFFSKEPWSSIAKEDVGTEMLQRKLASLLSHRVREELPVIRGEVLKLLEEAENNLFDLGSDLSTDTLRRIEYGTALNQLVHIYGAMVKGNYGSHELLASPEARLCAKLKAVFEKFAEKIMASSAEPTSFVAGDRIRLLAGTGAPYGALLDELKKGAPKATAEDLASPYLTWHKKELDFGAEGVDGLELRHDVTNVAVTPNLSSFTPAAICFFMRQIRENRGPELPGFLSFQVFTSIVQCFIRSQWVPLVNTLVSETCDALKSVLLMAADAAAKRSDRLLRFFREQVEVEVSAFKKRLVVETDSLLSQEMQPHTENHYYFDNIVKARSKRILDAVQAIAATEAGSVSKQAVIDAVTRASAIGKESNDECEAEDLRTYLSSYLKVAKKRFIDTVIGFVNKELLPVLTDKSITALTDAQLKTLLEEDVTAAVRRTELQQKVKTLQKAKNAFDEYNRSF
jgi:hypothetical protein